MSESEDQTQKDIADLSGNEQRRLLKRIGLRIQHELHLRTKTAEWLAFDSGVARSTVREIIAGRSNFRFTTLDSLAKSLGYLGAVDLLMKIFSQDLDVPAKAEAVPAEALRALGVNPGMILVVEDEPDVGSLLQEFLENEGYQVVWVRNGNEALQIVLSGMLPALVLLDLMMPDGDGWTFLEARKLDSMLSRVPVVVLSAIASRAKFSGAIDWLDKPIDLDKLCSIVQRYCAPTEKAKQRD